MDQGVSYTQTWRTKSQTTCGPYPRSFYVSDEDSTSLPFFFKSDPILRPLTLDLTLGTLLRYVRPDSDLPAGSRSHRRLTPLVSRGDFRNQFPYNGRTSPSDARLDRSGQLNVVNFDRSMNQCGKTSREFLSSTFPVFFLQVGPVNRGRSIRGGVPVFQDGPTGDGWEDWNEGPMKVGRGSGVGMTRRGQGPSKLRKRERDRVRGDVGEEYRRSKSRFYRGGT